MMYRKLLSLFSIILSLSLVSTGCDVPSAPEFDNVYDAAYEGGPFDFTLLLVQDNTFQLRWRDNSPDGIDYEVTRVDVFDRTDTLSIEVPIAERSLQDQLPTQTDVYEYVFDLAREQETTTNWTVVGYGMESYFRLSNNDTFLPETNQQSMFKASTGDGTRLFIWSDTDDRVYTQDMSLLPTRLELEFSSNGNPPTSHESLISPDNRTFCSNPVYENIGVEDIRCWDTSTGTLVINEARVIGHYFSLNRPGYLAVMSENTLEWWRLSDGQQEEVIDEIPGTPIEVSTNGSITFTLASPTDTNARPVTLSSLTTMQKQTLRKPKVFSPNNLVIGDCSPNERGVYFYDATVLLDNSNPSDGLLASIPAAIDCAFSPDGSQVVIQYNSDDIHGLAMIPVSALPNITTSASVQAEASLFIPHQFDVTDVTWTSANRLFTTGNDNIVHEWSLSPTIDIPRVDMFIIPNN